MSEIRPLHIRLLDVTVILVFLGLMRHRKTTIVAEELGVTQPAISHALKRLRAIYNDQLFYRLPHGLEPTAVANELEPLLQDALDTLAESLRLPKEFDPENLSLPIRIAGCDYFLGKILPRLIAIVSKLKNEVPIRAIRLSSEATLAELDNDSADLAVGYFSRPSNQYCCESLYADQCCLIAKSGHPALENEISAEFLANQAFLEITGISSCEHILDDAFSKWQLSLRRRASAPLVHPAFSALQTGDYLAAVPKRIAKAFSPNYGLDFRAMPVKSKEIDAVAVWHLRNEKSPLIAWLTPMIRSAFAGMDGYR